METVEVPFFLVVLASVYTAITIAIGVALQIVMIHVFVVNRSKKAYFHDWNDALKFPMLSFQIGGWLYRFQELLGNYLIPAPQRALDVTSYMMKSQVS